jgi:hypothetical protein
MTQIISTKSLLLVASSLFAAAWIIANTRPAAAQQITYPWCVSGEEIHCYYATREQCQETVDYHGFCVMNPDYRAGAGSAAPRPNRR